MTLEEKIDQVPDRPGVYLYKDAKAQIVYIGKAASLKSRVRSYFQESRARDPKTDALVAQIRDLEYIHAAHLGGVIYSKEKNVNALFDALEKARVLRREQPNDIRAQYAALTPDP